MVALNFGFTLSSLAAYDHAARALKHRADNLPKKDPLKLQERQVLYTQAAVFWMQQAAMLIAPERTAAGTLVLSTASAVHTRLEKGRLLFRQTLALLVGQEQVLQSLQMPWLMVVSLRLRAMCAFLSCTSDLAKVRRLKAVVDAPIKKEKAATAAAAKPPAKPVDIAGSTPPLTPSTGGPIATSGVPPPAVGLSLAECTELVHLLKELELLQEARDRWRAASALESASAAKSRKLKSGAGSLSSDDLALLSGADHLANCEHLESNSIDSVLLYVKRALPIVIRMHHIQPYQHDDNRDALRV